LDASKVLRLGDDCTLGKASFHSGLVGCKRGQFERINTLILAV